MPTAGANPKELIGIVDNANGHLWGTIELPWQALVLGRIAGGRALEATRAV